MFYICWNFVIMLFVYIVYLIKVYSIVVNVALEKKIKQYIEQKKRENTCNLDVK